ncbi:MAG TPA: Gfo/Idh/MocA family oxidoreductase, partial [Pirellulales bacterium]|nr:Gfo/Idh/MocA family oxidoreductase [Pirellulales bacterium]
MLARLHFVCLAIALVCTLLGSAVRGQSPSGAKKIRVGIIGLDTSHVTAFTGAVKNPKGDPDLESIDIVAAFPGGSPDLPTSADRVAGFTEKLKAMGVEIVPSIEALVERVDAVLLESVDGRPHLEQVRPVIAAKKPVFIDKPVAASLADAIEIYRLAEQAGVPCFSSSSLRFSPEIAGMRDNPKVGKVVGVEVHSPCSLDSHHPDLFWYGIHGVEMVYTIMGPGCVSVQRTHTDGVDVVTGVWKDGRVATYRGLRAGKTGYGGWVFGDQGIEPIGKYAGYNPLLVQIARFFRSGKPPVAAAETIELIAFMEAADESKRQGGCPVTIESVMAKASSA